MFMSLIVQLINISYRLFSLVLFIRVLLSWIPHNPSHPLIQIIYQMTEPLLRPFRNLIPTHKLGFDLSPILAFLALGFIRSLLFQILRIFMI